MKNNKIWSPSHDELVELVKNSSVLSDVLRGIGLTTSSSNYRSLKNRLVKEQIDFRHIVLGLGANKGKKLSWIDNELPLQDLLVEHSSYNRTLLKKRLIKNLFLKDECSGCGIEPEWNNKPLVLQLDHINGVGDDNRLNNLRLLCPNCHSQTETFGNKRGKRNAFSL